jgi:hypothetical protein
LRDQIAVVGELANERVDLLERELKWGTAVQVAAYEAVGGKTEIECGGAGIACGVPAVLARQREHAEDAPNGDLPLACVDLTAEETDRGSDTIGTPEQIVRTHRGAFRAILPVGMMTPDCVSAVLTQELTGA